MSRAVVIGGGIAGLATAALLARDGHEVELFERHHELGGRARVVERDGYRFDSGPSWFLMPSAFDRFFELLGTTTDAQLDLVTLDPGYRVIGETDADGGPYPSIVMPHGADRAVQLFEQLEPGSGPAVRDYLASATEASALAERYFLYNPFTRSQSLLQPEVVRALPRIAQLLTTSLSDFVARRFRHPLVRQVFGYPAVFLGTDPRHAPAIYHLMSSLDLDLGVQYPMGGFGSLVDALAACARDVGVSITTGAEVLSIATESRGRAKRARGIRWRDAAGVVHDHPANIVVSAADLHHTETALLAPEAQSYPERWWRRRQSGPGAVLVMLGVRGALPELEHHTLLFTRDWDANFDAIFDEQRVPDPASLYVCRPSATDPGVAPTGHENLFVLVPIPADPTIGSGGDDGDGDAAVEAIADRAIDQIAEWAGIQDLRERVEVRRTIGPADFARDYSSWSGGMLGPSHLLRQSAMFRAQNASRRVAGLYYAGGTVAPGVGVPMCLISAELVLKRIRGDHSPGPTALRSDRRSRG